MTEKVRVSIDPNQRLFTDDNIRKWENGRDPLSDEERKKQGFIGSEPLSVLKKYAGIYIKRTDGLFENIGTTEDGKNKPDERIFLYDGGEEYDARLGGRSAAGWKISRGDHAYSSGPWSYTLWYLRDVATNDLSGRRGKRDLSARGMDPKYAKGGRGYDPRTPTIHLGNNYLGQGERVVTLWKWDGQWADFKVAVNIDDARPSLDESVEMEGGGRKYYKKKRPYKNSKKKNKKRSYQNSRKSNNTKKRSKKRSKYR